MKALFQPYKTLADLVGVMIDSFVMSNSSTQHIWLRSGGLKLHSMQEEVLSTDVTLVIGAQEFVYPKIQPKDLLMGASGCVRASAIYALPAVQMTQTESSRSLDYTAPEVGPYILY